MLSLWFQPYLTIDFLRFSVIPDLIRNPVTLPFFYKTRIMHCQFATLNVAGYRRPPV